MPPGESNIILDLLAKSVEKLRNEKKRRLVIEENSMRVNKKQKYCVEDAEPQDARKLSTDELIMALVFNHLKVVTPKLAEEFCTSFYFSNTTLKLEDIVESFDEIDIRMKSNKPNETKSVKKHARKAFSFQEDDIIKAAMSKVVNGKVDCNFLAKQLNRTYRSISCRIEVLKSTGAKKKTFTLIEDQMILEQLVIPRLNGEKLSEIVLHGHQYAELTKQLNKSHRAVLQRWQDVLQPWLLQHFSGTLNLRVERMIATYIFDNFNDFSEIDWSMVAARPDLAGHTVKSLKQLFQHMVKRTKKKFNLEDNSLRLCHIVDYAEAVYGQGTKDLSQSERKLRRQKDVIQLFEHKLEQLNIKDFL